MGLCLRALLQLDTALDVSVLCAVSVGKSYEVLEILLCIALLPKSASCSSFQTGRSHRSHQDVNEGNLATPKSPGQREVPLDATCPGMIG